MAADLNLLVPAFQAKVLAVLAECKNRGYELRPFFTQRTPTEQALLWRQSRSREQIIAAAVRLKSKGAPWLAAVLEQAGPSSGPWATNALPGQSWHQFGEAVDCFVVKNGVAIWDPAHPGYVNYALIAQNQGLTPGRYWKGAADPPHIQLRTVSSPLHIMGWPEIEAQMKKRFPNG